MGGRKKKTFGLERNNGRWKPGMGRVERKGKIGKKGGKKGIWVKGREGGKVLFAIMEGYIYVTTLV